MPTANINGWSSSATYVNRKSLSRTNPYANDDSLNVLKLYGVATNQARHSVAFTWQVASAGNQITFTPSTGATTATDYIKFSIYDESGNVASTTTPAFQSSAATTPLAINTAALRKINDWNVVFNTSNNSGATKVNFNFHIDESQLASNSSGTVSYTLV